MHLSSTESKLRADQLLNDPRVEQARQLLRSVLTDHASRLQGVQPASAELQVAYDELLAQCTAVRGGKLYFPYLGSGLGNGALVELADGSVKYDMITGIGVHLFGHSDPDLMLTGVEAALSDTVMQGNLQQGREPALFSQELLDVARESGAPLAHCFLSTSGAMANENGLKILMQAKFPAARVLTFKNCFSGRTLALSQITDRAQNRVGLPTALAVDYIPFYERDRANSLQQTLAAASEILARYPNQHCCMLLELIQGEGGYYTAPREFFVPLLALLREHQIPILFDEIQTFGRTTRLFAFQHLQLDEYADVVTVGKLTQVCATLFREELNPQPGLVSQTFTGATASITAARHIISRLRSGDYYGEQGRIAEVHRRFVSHFERMQLSNPGVIHGPWGVGGMVAITAHDGTAQRTTQVLQSLYASGVMAFVAGDSPKRIRMLPPFGVITDAQIDEVCGIIEQVLQETR